MDDRNEKAKMTDAERVVAIRQMCEYCMTWGLPLPQNIHSYDFYNTVEGTTHLWEFEAKVTPSHIDGETQEALDNRRRAWLNEWIRDIVRKATGHGIGTKIEKKWSNDFAVVITSEMSRWRLEYSVKRDVVCEKKITGKKVVPERVVPEHEEEEFEWVCNDKSLLGDD